MILATHSHYSDNGIKLLKREGEKMSEGTIALVEDWLGQRLEMDGQPELPMAKGDAVGPIVDHSAGHNRYTAYFINFISLALHSFKDKRVALDGANGSAGHRTQRVSGSGN